MTRFDRDEDESSSEENELEVPVRFWVEPPKSQLTYRPAAWASSMHWSWRFEMAAQIVRTISGERSKGKLPGV